MRRSDRMLMLVCMAVVLTLVLSACGAFGGYFGAGGASRYCKDKQGKAIHCPERSDSTTTDTTHRER